MIIIKKRLNGCRAHGASAWIYDNPFPYSKFYNDEFRITAYMWLGMKITNMHIECRFFAGKQWIRYGIHSKHVSQWSKSY